MRCTRVQRHFRTPSLSRLLATLIVLLPCLLLESRAETSELTGQRELYSQAKTALSNGQLTTFRQRKDQLKSYPLYPYLEYADISLNIGQAKPDSINALLNRYPDHAFSSRLRQRWLATLASQKRWQQFISDYRDDIATTGLQCYYSYALYQSGNTKEAVEHALSLWQVGKSQVKECDPVFKILVDKQLITDKAAWNRFALAILSHNYGIARYARKFIQEPALQGQADLFTEVDTNPRTLSNYHSFTNSSDHESDIISHGISHLAALDAPLALKHWNRFNQSHTFTPEQQASIVAALVKNLYFSGHEETADSYLRQSRDIVDNDLLEWRLRELVKNADWQSIIQWRQALASRVDDDNRWLYWHARSQELTGNQLSEERLKNYQKIAGERSFYGFLASEWLDQPYDFNHAPVQVSQDQINTLASTEAFKRIKELYYHNELVWARREWQKTLSGQPQQSWFTAAKIAQQWQWYNQAIMTMIQIGYWDDIDLRFPEPHKEAFLSQAQLTDIPPNLLFALSRQESAFNDSVTSPAGAKGLMQLMPATAKETARRHNIRYSSSSDLFNPDKNIVIGSRYYKEMLTKFNNNRILATAAYNAGPARVYRWQKQTQGNLPFDAWIEIIPFRETRNYVQNVLAFSTIYAHHMNMDVDILSPKEKNTLL